jgi:Protein of unknown function (DUF2510)
MWIARYPRSDGAFNAYFGEFHPLGVRFQKASSPIPPPPGDEADSPAGYYPDPLGAPKLREWDGSSWTRRARRMTTDDAEAASGYRQWRLTVPRPFPWADPHRVLCQDGQELFVVPGGRWFYRDVRVCERDGTERVRLRRRGHWWFASTGYEPLAPVNGELAIWQAANTTVLAEPRVKVVF